MQLHAFTGWVVTVFLNLKGLEGHISVLFVTLGCLGPDSARHFPEKKARLCAAEY